MNNCTEERFLQDTENHQMEVLLDNGIYRHVKFSRDGSSTYQFSLVTWPGHLSISGDMGCYTFRRINDMFGFFNTDKNDFNFNEKGISINPGYWSEKMEGVTGYNKGKVFNSDLIVKSIISHIESCYEGCDFDDYINPVTDESFESEEDLIDALKVEVYSYFEYKELDEHRFVSAVDEFRSEIHEDFNFQDEWEWLETHEWSHHYIWCCYAIAYGVGKYNQANLTAISQDDKS